MKPADRVSDERLGELRCAYLSFANGSYDGPLGPPSVFEIRDIVAELQSRRAAEQAALPAVEEMAFKLADAAYRNSDADPKHFTHIQDEMEHSITPLYAKLSDLEAQLAAEASAVEVLGKVEAEVRSMYESATQMTVSDDFDKGRKSGCQAALLGVLDAFTGSTQ